MNEDDLLAGLDEFEEKDKLSTVDTTNFSPKDKLSLEVKEDEVRKHINLLETQRGDREDEDVDIDIKKAKLALMEHEDELIGKYKPVPTSMEEEPTQEKSALEKYGDTVGKVGDALSLNNVSEFGANLLSEIQNSVIPQGKLAENYLKKIGNFIGGGVTDAINYFADTNIDTYEKLRLANKAEGELLNETLDPKDKALLKPTESMEVVASLTPVGSSVKTLTAVEGALGAVNEYAKTGDIGEAGKAGVYSAGFTALGGKIVEKLFPDGGKVPTEFAKKIESLGQDDATALNKILNNLESKGIKVMDENARTRLVDDVLAGKMDDTEITANITAMLDLQKKQSSKQVTEAYDAANEIGSQTDKVPTSDVLRDVFSKSTKTKQEKKATKEITTLLKGKNLNAAEMESVLSDLKGLQSNAEGKGKYIYGQAIEGVQNLQDGLGGAEIYKKARAMSLKHRKNYTSDIKGATAGKQVGDVLESEDSYSLGKRLLGADIDPNKIGTAVEGLSQNNKIQIVQDNLMQNVDDITTPDGVKKLITNYKKMNPEGVRKLLGDEAANKMKLNMDSLSSTEIAIRSANKGDSDIAEELLDIATAASMVHLSPFLAARSTAHGVKKIFKKKLSAKEKGQLIARTRELKDPKVKRAVGKALVVLLNDKVQNMTSAEGRVKPEIKKETEAVIAETQNALVEEKLADTKIDNKEVEKEVKKEIKTLFNKDELDEFEKTFEKESGQKVEWGRGIIGKDGKGIYSRVRPSSSVTDNNYGTSSSIKSQISKVESNNSYTAKNPNSSAYGKYQFLDATYKQAAKALGMSDSEIREPKGQEKAMDWLIKENTAELKRRGIKPTPLNVYGIHQQGGSVFKKMINGEKLTLKQLKTIRNNIPAKYRKGNPVSNWFEYYGTKFS